MQPLHSASTLTPAARRKTESRFVGRSAWGAPLQDAVVLARAARRIRLRGELPRDVALEPQQVRVYRRLGRLERAPLARAGVGRGRRRARPRRVEQAQQRGRLRGHTRVAGPTCRAAAGGLRCRVSVRLGGDFSLTARRWSRLAASSCGFALYLSCTATAGGICALEGTRDMHACCQARPGGSLGSKRAISLRASSECTGVPQRGRMHLQRRRAIRRQRHQARGHVRGAAGR
jgi:hypothetical protein